MVAGQNFNLHQQAIMSGAILSGEDSKFLGEAKDAAIIAANDCIILDGLQSIASMSEEEFFTTQLASIP